MNNYLLFCLLLLGILTLRTNSVSAQQLYFPPLVGNNWETISPESLGWCAERIPALDSFLRSRNTKAFIILKDGKIAHERYFGTFTQDSLWYWASAGKSLAATLAGIAVADGVLDLEKPTSHYLGAGWTATTPEQESMIRVKHHLMMTTGLTGDSDDNCTDPECLNFLAPAGTRWDYHNGPYLLTHDILEAAYGETLQRITNQKLTIQTGITGLWSPGGVFISRARSMARFGLLILNQGKWNQTDILRNPAYFQTMTNSTSDLNPAYGYLWWLNGKDRFKLPGVNFLFPGKLIPNAPDDLIAGLGKYDQKVYVVPSTGLVVIRMGNAAGDQVAGALSSFDNLLWEQINLLLCSPVSTTENLYTNKIKVYPNPASHRIRVSQPIVAARFYSLEGRLLEHLKFDNEVDDISLPVVHIPTIVFLRVDLKSGASEFHRILIRP